MIRHVPTTQGILLSFQQHSHQLTSFVSLLCTISRCGAGSTLTLKHSWIVCRSTDLTDCVTIQIDNSPLLVEQEYAQDKRKGDEHRDMPFQTDSSFPFHTSSYQLSSPFPSTLFCSIFCVVHLLICVVVTVVRVKFYTDLEAELQVETETEVNHGLHKIWQREPCWVIPETWNLDS